MTESRETFFRTLCEEWSLTLSFIFFLIYPQNDF